MGGMDVEKVAVITGATGGIGAEVARALSGAGYRLVLSGRSAEKLSALAAQLKSPPVIVAGDLRDAAIPAKLLATALDKFGRCDVCFNNGGFLEVGPIETIDIERVCEMVRVNVEGAFRVAYVFLKHFVEQKTGHLVNTSSILGKKVRPTAGAYAGTKFAIEALSEALRMELSKTDVQVSCIEPGLVRTDLHSRWEVHPTESMGIAEPLTPGDVARMVLFILEQPPHVRIPQLMILPKGHEI
jgi:NADP-dependent 3-hydroxy acid dehydrogenase YdfG